MSAQTTPACIESVGQILNDKTRPLAERFRALFTLRNLGGTVAIQCIAQCFDDPSELLKHECAYCLGQMQDQTAIPYLIEVLTSHEQETIVRHEAGEALGAIGSESVLDILQQYCDDPEVAVAETCELAVARIRWLHSNEGERESLPISPYMSVDPAPPCVDNDVARLKNCLLDEAQPLFPRYRAMFSLRNIGTSEAALALAEGLKCKSALFRHEVAYVLGQMQHEAGFSQLKSNLQDLTENPMVRHECAEALGSIATKGCMDLLEEYRKDSERVVKESCEVALDMAEYENSGQFQYADGLDRIQQMSTVAS